MRRKNHQLDLSISLISYNNKELLQNCLNSIYQNTKRISFEILLVDNASIDESVQMVRQNFPKVKLIRNKKNLYFIKAHNQNLRKVKGRYFLVLNEDTELSSGCLDKMIYFMDKHPNIGLSSCRQSDDKGAIDTTCSQFPTPFIELLGSSLIFTTLRKFLRFSFIEKPLSVYRYTGWKRDTVKQVDVIPGSFFLGRSEVIEKIGLFDERFIFFYEEPDYCFRARKVGYLTYHNGKVTIKHLRAKGVAKIPLFKRFYISEHDLLAYYKKYFGLVWWLLLWLFLKPNWIYWRLKSFQSKLN